MSDLFHQQIIKAVRQFGTPFFIYDDAVLRQAYQELEEIMPQRVDIFYSMKANPLLGICEILKDEGACCEVCSENELIVALEAGFKSENIIFVGPAKTGTELKLCIKHKIYAVVCESFQEILQLNQLSKQANVCTPILIRINPDFCASNAPLKMGGKPTQFGIDWQELSEKYLDLLDFKNVSVKGIHIYNGSRILDVETIIENTQNILQLAEKFSKMLQIEFDCVDIGGGIGVPYFEGEVDIDIKKLTQGMHYVINAYLKKHANVRIILEAGRRLVAKAGAMVSCINYTKNSHGENFLITDAGMNCHMATTGVGSFIKRNFPTELITLDRNPSLNQKRYHITGPLCTPNDTVAKDVLLPSARVGDLVIIKASGAYGPTASPGRFLSHGYPAELLLSHDKLYLLRHRECANDILLRQLHVTNLLTTS